MLIVIKSSDSCLISYTPLTFRVHLLFFIRADRKLHFLGLSETTPSVFATYAFCVTKCQQKNFCCLVRGIVFAFALTPPPKNPKKITGHPQAIVFGIFLRQSYIFCYHRNLNDIVFDSIIWTAIFRCYSF